MKDIKIWKFNIFDIAIICLVVLLFIVVLVKTLPTNIANSSIQTSTSEQFVYEILFEGLAETTGEMIKVGDKLFDKTSSTHIGDIIDVKVEDANVSLEKSNGEIVVSKMPGKVNITLTVQANGTIKNNREYLANGLIRTLVGQTKEVKTKYVMASGIVTSINENSLSN